MRKHLFSFTLMLGLALSMMVSFTSCEKEGDTPNKPGNNCSLTGTVENVMCGTGAYGNLWIKGDDGKYYQPCESSVRLSGFTEGARVKFGYKVITKGKCDEEITCMVAVPRAVKMNLTCAQIISTPPAPCNLTGTIVDAKSIVPTCNGKLIKTADGKLLDPVNQEKIANLNAGSKVWYSYVEVQTFAASCTGATPVELTCLTWNWCGTPTGCTPITVDNSLQPGYGVNVLSATLDGNCLKLKVGQSGCSDHTELLQLVWNGSYKKSSPAMVDLFVHDPKPEMCEAYFTNEISFDLSKLKSGVNGPITIQINGLEQTIRYE